MLKCVEWREQKLKEILERVAPGDLKQKDVSSISDDLIGLERERKGDLANADHPNWQQSMSKSMDELLTSDNGNIYTEHDGRSLHRIEHPQANTQVYSESNLRNPSWVISNPIDYSVPLDLSTTQSFTDPHPSLSTSDYIESSANNVMEEHIKTYPMSSKPGPASSTTQRSLFSKPELSSYTLPNDAFPSKNYGTSDQAMLAQLDHSPQSGETSLRPSSSAFTLVPPTSSSSTVTKLPFSIREFSVSPLQGNGFSKVLSNSEPTSSNSQLFTAIDGKQLESVSSARGDDANVTTNSNDLKRKPYGEPPQRRYLVSQFRPSKSSQWAVPSSSGINDWDVGHQTQASQLKGLSKGSSSGNPDSQLPIFPSRSTTLDVNAPPFYPKSHSAPTTPTTSGFPIRTLDLDSSAPNRSYTFIQNTFPSSSKFATTTSFDTSSSIKQSDSVDSFQVLNWTRELDESAADISDRGLQNRQQASRLSSHPVSLHRKSLIGEDLMASSPDFPSTSYPIPRYGLAEPRPSIDQNEFMERAQEENEKWPLNNEQETSIGYIRSSLDTVANEPNDWDHVRLIDDTTHGTRVEDVTRPNRSADGYDRSAYHTPVQSYENTLPPMRDHKENPASASIRGVATNELPLRGPVINQARPSSYDLGSVNGGRLPRPGPIELPNPIFSITLEPGSSVKRPSLPSAASPVAVEEHSPSKIALYQAPEEIRSHLMDVSEPKGEGSRDAMHHYFEQQVEREGEASLQYPPGIVDDNIPEDLLIKMEIHAAEMAILNPAMDDLERALDDGVLNEDDPIPVDEPVNGGEVVPPAAAPPPAEEPWDDEWAHMLEAVGMIGPWYGIVQNVKFLL
jgi:hypothetical protein